MSKTFLGSAKTFTFFLMISHNEQAKTWRKHPPATQKLGKQTGDQDLGPPFELAPAVLLDFGIEPSKGWKFCPPPFSSPKAILQTLIEWDLNGDFLSNFRSLWIFLIFLCNLLVKLWRDLMRLHISGASWAEKPCQGGSQPLNSGLSYLQLPWAEGDSPTKEIA